MTDQKARKIQLLTDMLGVNIYKISDGPGNYTQTNSVSPWNEKELEIIKANLLKLITNE